MRLIIAAGLLAFAAPAFAFDITDNVSRPEPSVAPGLQYTVTGRDGWRVTVIEGQPRWTMQRRADERFVAEGDNIGAIVNIRQRRYPH